MGKGSPPPCPSSHHQPLSFYSSQGCKGLTDPCPDLLFRHLQEHTPITHTLAWVTSIYRYLKITVYVIHNLDCVCACAYTSGRERVNPCAHTYIRCHTTPCSQVPSGCKKKKKKKSIKCGIDRGGPKKRYHKKYALLKPKVYIHAGYMNYK